MYLIKPSILIQNFIQEMKIKLKMKLNFETQTKPSERYTKGLKYHFYTGSMWKRFFLENV